MDAGIGSGSSGHGDGLTQQERQFLLQYLLDRQRIQLPLKAMITTAVIRHDQFQVAAVASRCHPHFSHPNAATKPAKTIAAATSRKPNCSSFIRVRCSPPL